MAGSSAMAAIIAAVQAGGHSVFSPSAAHRWRNCTASLRASLRVFLLSALEKGGAYEGDDEDGAGSGSNFFSVEGTAAHHVAEVWLRKGRKPIHLLGKTFKRAGIEVVMDDEMFDHVERYVDWCQQLGGYSATDFAAIETRVELADLFPITGQGGTCDHLHYDHLTGTLTITDLKYGKGVWVYAEANDQLQLYAIGAINYIRERFHEDLSINRIVLRIAQPRLDHFPVWETDYQSLMVFAEETREKAREAWSANAVYSPDPKSCRFCPAKATCRALADDVNSLIDDAFGGTPSSPNVEIPVPGMTTVAEREEILRWRPTIDAWMKAIQQDLFDRADGGDDLQHFKIVEGRKSRTWRDPRAAAEWLEFLGLDDQQIWVRTLVSPHQAELALRKRKVGKRAISVEVTSTAGPRTLAPLIDPRSALAGSADVFEPVPGDDDDLD